MIVFRLDVNNDLMSLHIGDHILEINGTPVKDTPLENVENLLRYSDKVLQVKNNKPKTMTVLKLRILVDDWTRSGCDFAAYTNP